MKLVNRRISSIVLAVGLTLPMIGCSGAEGFDGPPQERVNESQAAYTTCYGPTCDGKDPEASGCGADGVTIGTGAIMQGSVQVGTIAIRKSRVCSAVWAHATVVSGTAYLRAELTRSSPQGTSQSASQTTVSGLKSSMLGGATGETFSAIGRIGPAYNYYPYSAKITDAF